MRHLFSVTGRADVFEWWVISIISDIVMQVCGIFAAFHYLSDKPGSLWISGGLATCALAAVWTTIAVTCGGSTTGGGRLGRFFSA